jgi:hypothetical protein
MNVKFYECVNEKKFKKTPKFDPCGGRTHNLVFPSSLLYHLHHHISLLSKVYIKDKACPATHNFKMLEG